ncbi:MAG: serine/threonine-protein kinase [Ornithinibacter sp.]
MTADASADGREPEDDETQVRHARLGQYRLVQKIGEGGMGVVHLALDRHGRAVAVKVLRPHVANDPDARARLKREVDTLSRIRSPRVAPVIDADVDGETPYIVTRYVPGPSLDDLVADRGPLAPHDLHRVAEGLAEALDVIHSAQVVHRDVKPGNVLLVDGDPVLIDFGIAHVVDDIRLTMTGLVMGTPGYLAPEVVAGEDVTPATDWWGWAATTAFAASGAPPFGRGGMNAVLARVSQGEPDLSAVDPRIEPLLYAALSPDPGDRPHHDEVVRALERFAHGGPVTEAVTMRRVRPSTQVLAVLATTALPIAPPPAAPAPIPVPAGRSGGGGLGPPGLGPPGWEQARRVDRGGPAPAAARSVAPRVAPPAQPFQHHPVPQHHPLPEHYPVPQQQLERGPDGPLPAGESDWDAARLGHGPHADPRIGRASRSGSLLALLALLAALTARAPLVALIALVAWLALARTADRSVTSLVMRRHERGVRGSDVAVAVATSPWHLVVGIVGAVVSVALPVLVGVCAMFASALVLTTATGSGRADGVVPLAAAGVFAGLTAWWGPGGASLRRGSRSIVRGMTPGATAAQVVAAALLLGAAVLLAATVASGGPSWAPRVGAPGWVDQVVPTP